MKKQRLDFDSKKVTAFALLFGLLTGCGLQRQGQYEGTEYSTANSITTQSELILKIQEQDNQRVTGTWSTGKGTNALSSGTFRGIINGNEIQKIYLTKSNSNSTSSLLTSGSAYAGTSTMSYMTMDGTAVCLGDYQGTLRFDGRSLSGSLQPVTTLQGNLCTKLDVDVVKVN